MKTVLCYGDSNTYGYDPRNGGRYPKQLRWPTILQELLGKEYDVVVEGLNGRTTAYDRPDGAFKNGLPYLITCMGSNKPIDYLIFMLGTNDCNSDLHLTSKDIQKGMEKLILKVKNNINLIQNNMPEIVIVVPAVIKEGYEKSTFAFQLDENSYKKSRELSSLYKELAQKYNTKYLDASYLQVSDIDCEHLTIESHNTLAHELAKLIIE